MSEEEIRAKRLEIQKRWESFGLTEGLQGSRIEKLAKLWESESKELLKDSDEEPQFPRIVKVPAPIFKIPKEDESEGE